MERYPLKFPYIVKVVDTKANPFGHDTIEWLEEQNIRPDRDFDLDMHGGHRNYTTFWFKDRITAIRVALMFG